MIRLFKALEIASPRHVSSSSRLFFLSSLIVTTSGVMGTDALAMGSKPQSQPQPGASCPAQGGGSSGQYARANPVRKVLMKSVETFPFRLPNGKIADLTLNLDAMARKAVTDAGIFQPTDGGDPSGDAGCDLHSEVRAYVKSLQFYYAGGLKFGYTWKNNGSGTSAPVDVGAGSGAPNVNGDLHIQGGEISMIFEVLQCSRGTCSVVSSVQSSSGLSSVTFDFTVKMDQYTGGGEFASDPHFADIVGKIMGDATAQFVKDPKLARLPWHARVRDIDLTKKTLIFDAGAEDNIGPQQGFVIYSAAGSGGVCEAYRAVGHAHSVAVNPISTESVIDDSTSALSVGDWVLIAQ